MLVVVKSDDNSGGLDLCPICEGEGELFEVGQEFDTREQQWYPTERSIGACPRCFGTGYVEPAEPD
jgi:hypothetical protein